MKLIRMSLVSLALCSVLIASSAWADDCQDALVAESCSCRVPVDGQGKGLRTAKKTSAPRLVSAKHQVAAEKAARAKPAAAEP